MRVRFFLCFFLGLCCFALRGQESDSALSTYKDLRAVYIQDETHLLGISLFTRNRVNRLELRGANNLDYNPNDVTAAGIRFQHKWLGVALTYSPTFMQAEEKGITKEIDLRLFVYGRKHNIDAYYINYQGFYIANYRSNAVLRTAYQQYPLLPDLEMEGAGINYSYVLNHQKYSLRSTYLHNEIQKKSAGSFLLGGSVNYLLLHNPVSIVPSELDSFSRPDERITNAAFYVASLMPGYAHTFVYRKLYITFAPMIGLALQFHHLNAKSGVGPVDRFSSSIRTLARFGVGYNSDKMYMGIAAFTDSYNYRLAPQVLLDMSTSDVRLILGYRFVPKGLLKRLSGKMDKIPISI